MGDLNAAETAGKPGDSSTTPGTQNQTNPVSEGADIKGTPGKAEGDTVSKEEYEKVKRERDKLKKATADKEEETLKSQNQYKDLYEKEKTNSTQKDEAIKARELKLIALQNGMHDPADIQLYKEKFQFDESFSVTNGKEVIEELKKSKAYLFKTGDGTQTPVPNTDTGMPPINQGTHIYTAEEIGKMTQAEYDKHQKVIMDQMKKGLIK